jgi:cell shape-determining protein MreC
MTYHSVKKKQTPRSLYIGVSILLVFLFCFFWTSFRGVFIPIIVPLAERYGVAQTFVGKGIIALDDFFVSKKKIAKENRNLLLTIERLENELALSKSELKEYTTLVRDGVATSSIVVVMYPLVTDYGTMYSTVLLSKGFKSGITEGSLVYVRGRQAVCTVINVYTNSSLCKLFSGYGETTEAVVGSTTVYLKGDGGSAFIAEVPKEDSVKEGDAVYLKKDQSFIVGEVVHVERDAQSAFWKMYVKGAYNPLTSTLFYTNQ